MLCDVRDRAVYIQRQLWHTASFAGFAPSQLASPQSTRRTYVAKNGAAHGRPSVLRLSVSQHSAPPGLGVIIENHQKAGRAFLTSCRRKSKAKTCSCCWAGLVFGWVAGWRDTENCSLQRAIYVLLLLYHSPWKMCIYVPFLRVPVCIISVCL